MELQMNISDLVWQMQHADGWCKSDFATILAEYNKDIGDDYFFRELIYKAVAANKLTPVSLCINMAIPPNKCDFLFTPESLIEWASSKAWNIPQSFKDAKKDENNPLDYQHVIQYLLKRKFPDLKLILAGIGDYGLQLDAVNAYFSKLKEHAFDELVSQYDQEKKHEQLAMALLAVRDDKLRFFNRPDANADFIHHCQKKTWTKDEAIALSFGKNPKIVNMDVLNNYRKNRPANDPPSDSIFIKDFEKQRDILFSDPLLEDIAPPKAFLEWFADNRISVHPELQKMAVAFKLIAAEKYIWMENILQIGTQSEFKPKIQEKNKTLSFFDDFFPSFPQKPDIPAEVIKYFLTEYISLNKKCPEDLEAWRFIHSHPTKKYQVIEHGKTLLLEGERLDFPNFKKRLTRYKKSPR